MGSGFMSRSVEISCSSKNTNTSSPKAMKEKDKINSLYAILANHTFLDAYATHCFHEFASESLLCIIECMQLKYYMVSKGLVSVEDAKMYAEYGNLGKLKLPNSHLPKSQIVYDETLLIDQKIKRLLKKYVLGWSELEVNISYLQRERLRKLYHDKEDPIAKMDMVKWYQFFDSVISELLELLRESCSRFMQSEEYKTLLS